MSWETVPLHKVASLESGFGFPRENQGDENQELPFFRVSDMNIPGNEVFMENHSNTVSASTLKELGARVFPAGTVIFPKIGAAIATEKKRILTKPATYDNNVMGAVPKDAVNPKFLYYWFLRLKLTDYANPGHVPSIRKSVMEEIPFPVVTPSEQSRIVELLDEADRLRRLRRKADAKAARILPALFLKMFGDPATNPMGWPMKPLGDLLSDAEVFVDGDWVESKDQDPNGEIRLIQLADIGDGFYIDKSSRFLTKETALRLRCTFLKSGDVLVARMPDPLGRACIFPGDKKEAVTVVDVCVIRPADDGPDPYWLMHCINSAGFRTLIAQQQTGTTRARISRGNLSRLPIISPPLPLQQEFSRLSKQTTEALPVAGAAGNIDKLFELLLQQAFSGQLTAKWRETHMKELLTEMEQQARLLNLPLPIEQEALA
jgi:type I restriction enzyme S subunit